MTDLSRVRISGSLQPFAAAFATELARQGYAPRSLLYQLHLMAHMSRWLTEEGRDVSDLPTQAPRFLSARRAAGYRHHLTGKALRPMLTYLRDLGAMPPAATPMPTGPVEKALARYRHYLTVERGLGEATARGYVDAVRPFLCSRLSSDGLDLDVDQLSEADVTAFVVARCAPPRREADRDRPALTPGFSPCRGGDHASTGRGRTVGGRMAIDGPAEGPRTRPRPVPAGLLRLPYPSRVPRLRDPHHARPSRTARRRSRDPSPRRHRLARR